METVVADEGKWRDLGERLRRVAPSRYARVLQQLERVVQAEEEAKRAAALLAPSSGRETA